MKEPTKVPPPKWLTGVLSVIILVVAWKCFSGDDDSKKTTSTPAPAAVKQASVAPAKAAEPAKAPAMQVTAVKLWSDYQANEVAADNVYKDKSLEVAGTVASIDKGPLGGIRLMLATPNEFMNVHASLDDSMTSKAASLRKGQPIALLCTGGMMVLGSPSLDDCTIK